MRILFRFLTTSPKFDNRRWAADGLAYLTLDADVKEELVEDQAALRSLFALCQSQDQNVLYSITTIFVNITNTYETKKAEKEMAELAKYAKQHVPKEHPKVFCRSNEKEKSCEIFRFRTIKNSSMNAERNWSTLELFRFSFRFVNTKVKIVENKSRGKNSGKNSSKK